LKIKNEENRIYPRINVSFPVYLTPDIFGRAVDISETGMSMVFDKPISLTKAYAKIELSQDKSVETEFKIVWAKRFIDKNGIKYGACFIKLTTSAIESLRRALIAQYLGVIFKYIDSPKIKDKITHFYCNDIHKYMKDFDSIESFLASNPRSLEDSCHRLKDITDILLKRADSVESVIDKRVTIKKIKESFRCLCGPLAYKGKLVKRAFEKPRGYPGDYLTIEYVYDNKSISEDMGVCCDRYFLSDKYASAVRNRKDKMKDMLIEYLSARRNCSLDILNIACGSCREIKDIFSAKQVLSGNTVFSLVDQDQEALDFSEKSLSSDKPKNTKINYFQHDITNYIKDGNTYSSILGRQDLIYSIGLADYLPDIILKKVLSFFFGQLKDRGTLIFAHKDIDMYKPVSTDWWCNWTFYSRNEKKVLELLSACGMGDIDIKLEREKSGLIIFFIISKKQ